MSKDIIPIFTSDASLGKSILTTDKNEKIVDNKPVEITKPEDILADAPVSIFSIAKAYNLDQIYLAENSMVSFNSAYKQANKLNKQLIFGIKLIITPDPLNKEDKSKLSDSNVIVWMKTAMDIEI